MRELFAYKGEVLCSLLLKLVRCQIGMGKKDSFSRAQQRWKRIKKCRGFAGQIGGWDDRDHHQANILALWETEEDYQVFMREHHDEIYYKTKQEGTFQSIEVQTFDVLEHFSHGNFCEAWKEAKVLRVTLYKVIPEQTHLFVETQAKFANPSLVNCTGMLGLYVAYQDNTFLVVSLWDHMENHEDYMLHTFQHLREQTKSERYITYVKGSLLHIEKNWIVNPNKRIRKAKFLG